MPLVNAAGTLADIALIAVQKQPKLFPLDLPTFIGSAVLTSDAEVESFAASYSRVVGSVTISGSGVTNIAPLYSLLQITGSLTIDQTNAVSAQFQAKTDGVISITSNALLQAVNLSEVSSASALTVASNLVLRSLDLSALGSISGSLTVTDNPLLKTVLLTSLLTVGGAFSMNNHAVVVLDLSTITSIGNDLTISNNAALVTIDLSGLVTLSGDLTVENNPELVNLLLPLLATLTGELSINNNPKLLEVNLPSLNSVGGGANFNGNSKLVKIRIPIAPSISPIFVDGSPELDEMDFSGLVSVVGDFTIYGSASLAFPTALVPNLSSLASVSGCLYLQQVVLNYFSLPALTSVGCLQMLGCLGPAASCFPVLSSAGTELKVESYTSSSSLASSFPALTSVSAVILRGQISSIAGAFPVLQGNCIVTLDDLGAFSGKPTSTVMTNAFSSWSGGSSSDVFITGSTPSDVAGFTSVTSIRTLELNYTSTATITGFGALSTASSIEIAEYTSSATPIALAYSSESLILTDLVGSVQVGDVLTGNTSGNSATVLTTSPSLTVTSVGVFSIGETITITRSGNFVGTATLGGIPSSYRALKSLATVGTLGLYSFTPGNMNFGSGSFPALTTAGTVVVDVEESTIENAFRQLTTVNGSVALYTFSGLKLSLENITSIQGSFSSIQSVKSLDLWTDQLSGANVLQAFDFIGITGGDYLVSSLVTNLPRVQAGSTIDTLRLYQCYNLTNASFDSFCASLAEVDYINFLNTSSMQAYDLTTTVGAVDETVLLSRTPSGSSSDLFADKYDYYSPVFGAVQPEHPYYMDFSSSTNRCGTFFLNAAVYNNTIARFKPFAEFEGQSPPSPLVANQAYWIEQFNSASYLIYEYNEVTSTVGPQVDLNFPEPTRYYYTFLPKYTLWLRDATTTLPELSTYKGNVCVAQSYSISNPSIIQTLTAAVFNSGPEGDDPSTARFDLGGPPTQPWSLRYVTSYQIKQGMIAPYYGYARIPGNKIKERCVVGDVVADGFSSNMAFYALRAKWVKDGFNGYFL